MTKKLNQVKTLFPDLFSLDKAINQMNGKKDIFIKRIHLAYIIKKIMTEDAELLKHLATNEPLNQ